MDVLFYDFDFNLLADIPRAVSVNIDKKYCGFGTAEMHFSIAESRVLEILRQKPYVFCKCGEDTAIVTGWKTGKDIAIFGRTPEWLLTRRGVKAFEETNKTAEEIAINAVRCSAEDCVEVAQMKNLGEIISFSTDGVRVLHDVIVEILKPQGLGFMVEPDIPGRKFVFSVYSGIEQSCVVSLSNRTAYDFVYTVEKQDMVTASGWYERKYEDMGDWNAITNSPVLFDNRPENVYKFYRIVSESKNEYGYKVENFGLICEKGCYLYCNTVDGKWKISQSLPQPEWVFVNNSDLDGAKRWDAVLAGTKTADEALSELARRGQSDILRTEVRRIEYGKDYRLGDIVRVQFEYGDFKKVEKKRVDSVSLYYDTDRCGVSPTLKSLEG